MHTMLSSALGSSLMVVNGLIVGVILVRVPVTNVLISHLVTLLHECGHTVATILCAAVSRRPLMMHRLQVSYDGSYFGGSGPRDGNLGETVRLQDADHEPGLADTIITAAGYPAPAFLVACQTVAAYFTDLRIATIGALVVYGVVFFACLRIHAFTLLIAAAFLVLTALPLVLGSATVFWLFWYGLFTGALCYGALRSCLGHLNAGGFAEGHDAAVLARQSGTARGWMKTMTTATAVFSVVAITALLLTVATGK